MNCIVVDIGNTSTAVGLARSGRIMRVSHLEGGMRDRRVIELVLRDVSRNCRIDGAAVCSVVPKSTASWETGLYRACGRKPLTVSHRVKLGVGIDYPKPSSIGADRLANATGAVARYGAPVVVADFGTALTFDVISKQGNYVGGVIAPGLPLMTDYLADRTALLPRIRLTGACSTVGKSTAGAMRIGAHVGYRGIAREIVNHLRESPDVRGAKLCATGGYAKWALAGLDMPFAYDPHITLFGLSRIFELNCGGT